MMETQLSNADWNEITHSIVYRYAGKKAKTHTHVFVVFVLFLGVVIVTLTALLVSGTIDRTRMAMLFFAAFLLLVAYVIWKLQFGAMKALTQYYVDADRNCYKVQFTKVAAKVVRVQRQYSLVPLVGEVKTLIDAIQKLKEKEALMEAAYQDAQEKALGYYYVKRWKSGVRDWNWLSGGEAKVVLLGKINAVRIPSCYRADCSDFV